MFNIKKYISNLILEHPLLKNNRSITPEEWEEVIAPLNVKINFINGLIEGVLAFIIFGILLHLVGIFFLWALIIVPVIIIVKFKKAIAKGDISITVKNGSKGVITLFGNRKGKLDVNNILLADGKFRQIANISILYSDIFGTVTLPKKLPSFEYTYKNVLTNDVVSINGEHSFFGIITDPYVFVDFSLSTMVEGKDPLQEIENYVEEISLAAMKNAFDELGHSAVVGKGGTEALLDKYKEALMDFEKRNKDCTYAKCEFYSGEHHPSHRPGSKEDEAMDMPQIGITGSFLIKTAELPGDLQKTYNEAAGMGKFTEIELAKAEAAAARIRKEGEANADAKALLIEKSAEATTSAAEEAYKKFKGMADNPNVTYSELMRDTRLATDMVSNEFELIVGGADGKTPRGILAEIGAQGENADALLIGLIKEFGLKKEFDEFFKNLGSMSRSEKIKELKRVLKTT